MSLNPLSTQRSSRLDYGNAAALSSPPCQCQKQDRAGAREVVLAWMSLMCQLNEDRTLLGEARKLLNATHLMTGGLTVSGHRVQGLG